MKKISGFTLIEIVIAIAIIGALAAIAIFTYRDYTIKAAVADALEDADVQRVAVEVALIEGKASKWKKDPVRWELATPSSDANQPLGHLVVNLDISGIGNKDVLAFRRLNDGTWLCVNAAKAGSAIALDEKYLPASCRGAGTTIANNSPTCPADQEMVMLTTGAACTQKCPVGQTRDKTNPTLCKEPICGPDERKNGSGVCVHVGAPPDCGASSDPHIAYSYDNTPAWNCFPKCPAGNIRDSRNWFSCIPDPNAKAAASVPPASVAPVAAAPKAATPTPAVPAGSANRPGAASQQSIQCHVCNPELPPELCELVTIEQTCTYPKNWCVTFVDNHADGTKAVTRRCGDFPNDAEREWYQGTSDDDKCRERIDVDNHLDFTCTFACDKENCNQSGGSLRPKADSLYQPK